MITVEEAILRQYDFLRYCRREIGIGKQYALITAVMQRLKRKLHGARGRG